ncbi:DUF6713 family protein [Natronospora cellulosivora (SeqCode)]
MRKVIILISVLNVIFVFMHEFDACYCGEWKMFRFIRKCKEKTQYLIFLYIHLPLTLFLFYYLWTVVNFNNIILWVIINAFLIFHFVLHLIARRWKSNVFLSYHSFIFIAGAALTGIINLCLIAFY